MKQKGSQAVSGLTADFLPYRYCTITANLRQLFLYGVFDYD